MNAQALTQTDLRTASLLGEGNTRKEIARIESVSLSSVNSRVDTILFKTLSKNTVEAIQKLAKCGLIALIAISLMLNDGIDGQRRARRPALRLARVVRLVS